VARRGFDRRTLLAVTAALLASPAVGVRARSRREGTLRGFNVIETSAAPFGSAAAAASLRQVAATGANAVALVPFLWQPHGADPGIVLGDALPAERLAAGIAQAREAGLQAIVKPHVWVPDGWAGVVAMQREEDWPRWFGAYRAAILPLAELAASAGAAEFVIGTELRRTVHRPEWLELIAAVRERFAGPLTYVSHGADEVERVPFWGALDAVGASLYPVLGKARDKQAWRSAMEAEIGRVRQVAERAGRPVWIGEIGIRSARNATPRPWESAEERAAPVDLALQANVIDEWLGVLDGVDPAALLVWRWFSDPEGGGPGDTDFTVQRKPAADRIAARWHRSGTTPPP
jgi:hypothetical protein